MIDDGGTKETGMRLQLGSFQGAMPCTASLRAFDRNKSKYEPDPDRGSHTGIYHER